MDHTCTTAEFSLLYPPSPFSMTLIERKLRTPQVQGVKGEAIVSYAEPLTTQEMECHRLSRRVNKMKIQNKNHISSIEELQKRDRMLRMWPGFYMIQCFFILFTLNQGSISIEGALYRKRIVIRLFELTRVSAIPFSPSLHLLQLPLLLQ